MAKTIYGQDYINKCFNTWYLSERPKTPQAIRKILPEHPSGRLPSFSVIERWVIAGAWDARADELDAAVLAKNDKQLINVKARMLKKHTEQAEKVTTKALDHLIDKGFDSSSAAVQAFYRGLEEQRKTQGFSDLLEKLDKMTNNDVEREIVALLNRASENDQVVEVEAEDIPEIENIEED
jgi:hypothetical protein